MHLKSVILENFRSYREKTRIDIDDITAFIGKNDHGKSTILEALEIFFNNKLVKISKEDVCVYSDHDIVRIGCVFDQLPDTVLIDESAHTTLKEEYLLNEDGDLEIHRIYDCGKTKITTSVLAVAYHPTRNGMKDLLLVKQDDLRKKFSELGLDASDVDMRVNAKIRRAIWGSVSAAELEIRPTNIPLDNEDAKKIWDPLSKHLPTYALFQSDRSSSDGDAEVQDPMKLAVAEAIKTVEQDLEKITEEVRKKATEVAQRTLDKLTELDPNLASELKPEFSTLPKWEGFKLSLMGDDGIPINKRGSGARRLILLSFFRAEAERQAQHEERSSMIYAIEEPETSQHPSNQEMLVESLIDLSKQQNRQVLLTTHVPRLAGLLPLDSLRFVEKVGTLPNITSGATDVTVYEKIADSLGILPDPRSSEVQVLFCVEGPHDIDFFLEMSEILHSSDPTIPSLKSDRRVTMLPLGGGNLKNWVDNHYLRGFKLPEFHIYDRDITGKYKDACNLVNARGDGSWATLTTKREIENYLHPDAIFDALGVTISFGDNDDVEAIFKRARSASSVSGKAKYLLNSVAVKSMTVTLLKISDPSDDIITWLKKLASMLK